MTKIVVTDTALKAGEPWAYAPVHVDLVDANGDTVHPAYVTLTGVLVEAFDTTADADGTFTVTLDPTDAIAPSGCLYAVTIGDADPILVNGDQGSGTVRGLRTTTGSVLGNTATLSGLSDVNIAGRVDGSVIEWDTATGKWIMGTGGGGGGGGVTSVSGTPPITSTGGATPAIGISAATTLAAGSMSASDKSKLDGIEAGATADQSASELLTAIKTVDGASSGLDADTVDGQHASAFEAAGTAAALVDDLSGVSNASTARTNLGLGGAATLNVGTTAGTVAAGDHNHSGVYEAVGVAAALVDDLSGVSNAATARTNLGLGGLATLSAISSSEITNGTIVNEDVSATAAIALSKLADIATARLLGRTTAGAGAIEELSSADSFVSAASDTTAGKVELATTAEATGGTDTSRAVVATGLIAAVSAYNAFAYL